MTIGVFKGMVVTSQKDKDDLNDFLAKEKLPKAKVLFSLNTTSGQGGPGGRTDTVVNFIESKDRKIGRLAVHPLHLSGSMSWGTDYLDNNRGIISSTDTDKLEKLVEKHGG